MIPGRSTWTARIVTCCISTLLVVAGGTGIANATTDPIAGTPGSVGTQGLSWGTSIADVTGDGRKDLIVTDQDGDPAVAYSLLVYPQLAGGALALSPTIYHLSGNPDGPYWEDWLYTDTGDLDHDGDTDVVVGRNGGLEIFHQSGGVLQSPDVLTAAGPVVGIAVVDVNGDGKDDLVYAVDIGNGQFTIVRRFQGTAGAFGSEVAIATVASGRFGVGDINSDGRPDIAVHEYGSTETQILLHNQANQAYTSSTISLGSVMSTAVADVNGDGHNDLLALQPYELWMLAGKADGSLAAPAVLQPDIYLGSGVATADMNADGRSDVVVFSQGGLDVLLQSAAGTLEGRCPFPSITPAAQGPLLSEVAIGDLDGDNRPDAAASEMDDQTRITRQIAPGSPVTTALSIEAPSTGEIGTPITVSGSLDAGVYGCLGSREVDVWRQLPGAGAVLLDTVTLRPYGGTTWLFDLQDDPGQLGSVAYQATWAGDGFRDSAQSPWQSTEITKRATSLTLQPSDPSVNVGQTTLLQATLTGGEPASDVSFYDVTSGVPTLIDTIAVDGAGAASLEVSPATSTTYRAVYAGDAVWAAATSPDAQVAVSKWATSLRLSPSDHLIAFGSKVTLTAKLKGGSGTRPVAFYSVVSGTKRLIGTANANADGVAKLTIAPKRNASYVAQFAGDATWASSKSSKELVEVHVLATGRMTGYHSLVHGIAVYGCCRAFYIFKVVPNYAGKSARIGLDVRTPDGDWLRLNTKSFKLHRDSTVKIYVVIEHPGGHTFQLTGCLRDQPQQRGSCSRGDLFRFSS